LNQSRQCRLLGEFSCANFGMGLAATPSTLHQLHQIRKLHSNSALTSKRYTLLFKHTFQCIKVTTSADDSRITYPSKKNPMLGEVDQVQILCTELHCCNLYTVPAGRIVALCITPRLVAQWLENRLVSALRASLLRFRSRPCAIARRTVKAPRSAWPPGRTIAQHLHATPLAWGGPVS
jgi:hypothetical protein